MLIAVDIGIRVHRGHSWSSIFRMVGRNTVVSTILLWRGLRITIRLLRRGGLLIAISATLQWWRAIIWGWGIVWLGWVLLGWWSSISSVVSVVSRAWIVGHLCSTRLSRRGEGKTLEVVVAGRRSDAGRRVRMISLSLAVRLGTMGTNSGPKTSRENCGTEGGFIEGGDGG